MDSLHHQFIFQNFSYSLSTLLKTFFHKNLFSDNDLRWKLVENNQKMNNTKEIFLFLLSLLFIF